MIQNADQEDLAIWRRLSSADHETARHAIFNQHVGWTRGIAVACYRERNRGDLELPEVCQLAYTGLLEAIDHFDVERGVPFRSFAGRRIRGCILDGLSRSTEVRRQISVRHRLRRDRARSLMTEPGGPSDIETALSTLSELVGGLAIGFLLEQANLGGEAEREDSQPNAYESLSWKEVRQQLQIVAANLDDRSRLILKYHYKQDMTFEQIGHLLHLSKGRISQIHKDIITGLRRKLSQFDPQRQDG